MGSRRCCHTRVDVPVWCLYRQLPVKPLASMIVHSLRQRPQGHHFLPLHAPKIVYNLTMAKQVQRLGGPTAQWLSLGGENTRVFSPLLLIDSFLNEHVIKK